MYRRNLKAIIVAFVLVSGFGIGTAAHVSAADTMSPQGAAQSKSVNQNVATGTKVVTGTVTDPSGETLIGLTVKVSGTNVVTTRSRFLRGVTNWSFPTSVIKPSSALSTGRAR